MTICTVEGRGAIAARVHDMLSDQRIEWGGERTIAAVGPGARAGRSLDVTVVSTMRSDQLAAEGVTHGVASCGLHGLGDVVAEHALAHAARPAVAHVAWAFPDRGGLLRLMTPGQRSVLADDLARPVVAWEDGARREEHPAETRLLAWFPRPLSAQHVGGVPGLEPELLRARHPALRDVRTSVAMRSMTSELIQFLGRRVVTSDRARARIAERIRRRKDVGDAARRQLRWAVVVEVVDEDGSLVRTWASGRDPVGVTSAMLVIAAARASHAPPKGIVGPGGLGDPAAILDGVGELAGIHWGRVGRVEMP